MRIAVFGATGMVGQALLPKLLAQKVQVLAFGRNALEKITAIDGLEPMNGSVFQLNEVKKALAGCTGVISVLGGGIEANDVTRSLGMKRITEGMQACGLQSIVALGGMGVLPDAQGAYLFEGENFPEIYIPVSREHARAYETLRDAKLTYSFVCPPDILDQPATGRYIVANDQVPEGAKYQISVGDLADFMVREWMLQEHAGHRIGIGNV